MSKLYNLKYFPEFGSEEYLYIHGEPIKNKSIAENRYDHLRYLNTFVCSEPRLIIASKDINQKQWTKWKPMTEFKMTFLESAYEIHRNMLYNEIVIESDYDNFEQNLEASRYIGDILEQMGFIPHYYYGGNKSLHIHIYIDYLFFLKNNSLATEKITSLFDDKTLFMKTFIEWLRDQIINNWNGEFEFDKNLIKNTHLIRSELSKNKLGYKTFLGYTYKKLPKKPEICNVETKQYPKIASCYDDLGNYKMKLKISKPNNTRYLLEQFIYDYTQSIFIANNSRIQNRTAYEETELKYQIRFMLSDNFAKAEDGFKRAMFIIINELKKFKSDEEIEEIMIDWNVRMGNVVKDSDIKFRIRFNMTYILTTKYINDFLEEVGFNLKEIKKFNQK